MVKMKWNLGTKYKHMPTSSLWGVLHAGWGVRQGFIEKVKLHLGLGGWTPSLWGFVDFRLVIVQTHLQVFKERPWNVVIKNKSSGTGCLVSSHGCSTTYW